MEVRKWYTVLSLRTQAAAGDGKLMALRPVLSVLGRAGLSPAR